MSSPQDGVSPADAALRISYTRGTLDLADLRESPLAQFQEWFADAVAAGIPEPNAMVLSTATPDAQPSSRTVLLKAADARGFVLYTNLTSRKSQEMAANPGVSLVFPWIVGQHRQVVVVGRAELVGRDEVAEYFHSRPHESQLGAWTSRQSSVIEDRDVLEARFAELAERYPGDVPVPDFWGGWLVRPVTVEFWQGRPSRLHDRLRFRATVEQPDLSRSADWIVERLSP